MSTARRSPDGDARRGGDFSGEEAMEAAPRPLDQLDLAIARALERDSRMSLLDLARQVGASRPTVSERLGRLIEQGVIRGFHARLDYHRLGYPITAFVGLSTQQSPSEVDVVHELEHIPEIEEIHAVTGRIDLLLKVRARSTEHLRQLLTFKIQALPNVTRSETMIVLTSHLDWAPVGRPRAGTDFTTENTERERK
jgi:Lrp/AsnC family transcriptional regulator for asnA, asnC and gidA